MNGGIPLDEDDFDELPLESKLGVLFKKAIQNGKLLEDIHTQCQCRQAQCELEFTKYKDLIDRRIEKVEEKGKSLNIIERFLTIIAGGAGGYFGGKVG